MKKQQFFLLYLTLVFIILAQIGNSAISETIFGDHSIISMTPANSSVFIDLRDKNKANINFRKELNDKSLADFSDFLRNSRNVYFTIWIIRIVQVNALDVHNKEQQIFINPLRWWRNFFGFQNKSRKRGDFELKDGDSFKTNWVAHPAFGAYTYL